MTLAPIRGAPSGAAIPDFPAEQPNPEPLPTIATPISDDPRPSPPARQPYAPVEISGGGITLTFRVIPEQPAISRASMTVHVVAQPVDLSTPPPIGFLRMSADAARRSLTDLRDGRFPIVTMGDEDGSVEIVYEVTDREFIFSIRKAGLVFGELRIDDRFDVDAAAKHLLVDLGA